MPPLSDLLRTASVTSLGGALLLATLTPASAVAAERCKAKVDRKTGAIEVAAKNVAANPVWGSKTGETTEPFANEGTCFAKGKLKDCLLGPLGTLASKMPPFGCEVFVSDDSGNQCSALIKGCTPGFRAIDDTFSGGDPRRALGLTASHDHDDDYVNETGDAMTGKLEVDESSETAIDVFQDLPATIDATRPPAMTVASRVGSGIDATSSTLELSHQHASGVRNIHTILSLDFSVNSGVDAVTTGMRINRGSSITSGGTFTPIVVQQNGTNVARVADDGAGYFNGGTFTSGADFAESVAVDQPPQTFEPGDVLAIDTEGRRRFALADGAESPLIAGIYSTKPGIVARPGDVAGDDAWRKREVPLAITGIVPCKVTDEGGPIRTGDLLVSASTPGHAKRAPESPKPGTVLGKALEPLTTEAGKVEILLTLR